MNIVIRLNLALLYCMLVFSVNGQQQYSRETLSSKLKSYYAGIDLSIHLEDYRTQFIDANQKAKVFVETQEGKLGKIAFLLWQTAKREKLRAYFDLHSDKKEVLELGEAIGDELDSSDLELLGDQEIEDYIDAYYSIVWWNRRKIDWVSDVLFNVQSERIRNVYVLPVLRTGFKKNGYTKVIQKLCENIGFCSEMATTLKEIEHLKEIYIPLQQGTVAPEFSLENEKGETVNLSNLKGKIVFVMIWSLCDTTYMHELELFMQLPGKYRNQFPVEFIDISVNSRDEQRQWMDVVQGLSLKNKVIHLFCDWDDTFIKDYLIDDIQPRFVFIETDGTIRNAWYLSPVHPSFSIIFKETDNNIPFWND